MSEYKTLLGLSEGRECPFEVGNRSDGGWSLSGQARTMEHAESKNMLHEEISWPAVMNPDGTFTEPES
jgi:hypothetical protein